MHPDDPNLEEEPATLASSLPKESDLVGGSDATVSYKQWAKVIFPPLMVLVALLLLVHFYGRGQDAQSLNHTLLPPYLLEQGVWSPPISSKMGKRYFTEMVLIKKSALSRALTFEQYRQLHTALALDESLRFSKEMLEKQFTNPPWMTLELQGREQQKDGLSGRVQVVQEVQFHADGHHYRVRTEEAGEEPQWHYFRHPTSFCDMLTHLEEGGHEPSAE